MSKEGSNKLILLDEHGKEYDKEEYRFYCGTCEAETYYIYVKVHPIAHAWKCNICGRKEREELRKLEKECNGCNKCDAQPFKCVCIKESKDE